MGWNKSRKTINLRMERLNKLFGHSIMIEDKNN